MSDSDSFIAEVTDEVRRDQLFAYLRRYGWIAVVAVLALVGGAAWFEVTKARDNAAAQAAGDAVLAAMAEDDSAARLTALQAAPLAGDAAAVAAFLEAAEQQDAGDLAAAAATLDGLANNAAVDLAYRELAQFKWLTVTAGPEAPANWRDIATGLAQPGATYSLLASEQIALADVAAGDTDAAVATLRAILEDASVTRGLRERAQNLMVALGQEIAPAPDAAASN